MNIEIIGGQTLPSHDPISVLNGDIEVSYEDHMGTDCTVVNAARVSFNKKTTWEIKQTVKKEDGTTVLYRDLYDKDKKLIEYLAKHNHWAPFAHPTVMLRLKTPIPVRVQLDKSRIGFVMSEVSRRYIRTEPTRYSPRWRYAPHVNIKQGSGDFASEQDNLEWKALAEESMDKAIETYMELINKGAAPEQARFVLPLGVHTEYIWTGSLLGWARVVRLRKDEAAQWETRQAAACIDTILRQLFPFSWEVLTERDMHGTH